jgi:catechol 2,3-dioxygenase-like lactoylglutathione lyase family enzyme
MAGMETMNAKHIVPIVITNRMRETRAFYVDQLGFELSFDHEHYLGVRGGPKGAPEIGFMPPDAETPHAFDGKGLSIAIGVADVDAEFARLRQLGVRILQEPKDQPWGGRTILLQDPNGVILYLSHPIPANVEFLESAR